MLPRVEFRLEFRLEFRFSEGASAPEGMVRWAARSSPPGPPQCTRVVPPTAMAVLEPTKRNRRSSSRIGSALGSSAAMIEREEALLLGRAGPVRRGEPLLADLSRPLRLPRTSRRAGEREKAAVDAAIDPGYVKSDAPSIGTARTCRSRHVFVHGKDAVVPIKSVDSAVNRSNSDIIEANGIVSSQLKY